MRIYFDTEFVSLWRPECMSIGMAADDGTTLYVVLEYNPEHLSRFSREIVVPLLGDEPTDIHKARGMIRRYLSGYDAPELVCDFIGDWWLLLNLLPDLADYAVPRCAMQGAPDMAYKDIRQRHNALADAIALREWRPSIQQDTD